MKFENIKEGDSVLVIKKVSYGWRCYKQFYVRDTVKKITKTQFSTETGHRFKKNGSEIGQGCFTNCYYQGDLNFKNQLIKDQTKEMEYFISKLSLERTIITGISKINIELNSKIKLDDLKQIQEMLSKINQLTNNE